MEFSFSRGFNGKQPLSAKTKIDLGFDRHRLIIETHKSRTGLESTAYVVQVSEDGYLETRAFGVGKCGGFTAKIAERTGARATEKAVQDLHLEALDAAEQMKAAALAHYGQKATHGETVSTEA